MTLPDAHAILVAEALDAVVAHAAKAKCARDTDGAKRELNAVWFAVHRATETINTAESEARRQALAHVEGPAA